MIWSYRDRFNILHADICLVLYADPTLHIKNAMMELGCVVVSLACLHAFYKKVGNGHEE